MIMVLIRNLMLVAMTILLAREMVRVHRDGSPGEDTCGDLPFHC
jgi:hypothetical protein